MNLRPALFLDRDGVINIDRAYVSCREDFHFMEGIFELCREAKRLGYWIIVITNQAGIGRGYYTEDDFLNLTAWMKEVFKAEGVEIDAVYFSPYHPEYGVGKYKKDTNCRKPKPGMILQATSDFKVDLNNSILIGDKDSDIEAGHAAGVGRNILFIPPEGKKSNVTDLDFAYKTESLREVARFLCEK